MALKLRKRKSTADEDQSAVEPEAPAEPGKPGIPPASYNVMTVRYAVQQRRNLAAIILMGIVAIVLLLAIGNWLKIRTDQAATLDSIDATQQEILTLSTQLTDLSDTAGLAPEEVSTRLAERQAAFVTAAGSELDYTQILADTRDLNTNRVWVTDYTFTTGESPAMQVAGQAIDPLDVSDWYEVYGVQVPYGTLLDDWPQFSGTPGEATAEVLWTANIQLGPDAAADRAAQYGIVIDPALLQPETPPEEADATEDTTTDGAP